MGQSLSEPVTEKSTSMVEDSRYKVGCSSMQGWRNEMEDAHTCLLSMDSGNNDGTFFAVFDGHGGHEVAMLASEGLHKSILRSTAYRDGNMEEAIWSGFLTFDQELLANDQHNQSGSTAVCTLIRDNIIYCGNVGDSRAVASVAGNVEVLSHDHKPNVYEENLRIVNAGGWVEFNRVNGNLALSRALGDFVYKRDGNKSQLEQIVVAEPEVIVKEITPSHEFIVLACDGIWDVMTNEEVVEFVRSEIAEGTTPDMICEKLMTRCLAPDCRMGGVGCDNMTVVLVCLLQGESYASLCDKCSYSRAAVPLVTTESVVAKEDSSKSVGSLTAECQNEESPDEWFDCNDGLILANDDSSSSPSLKDDNTETLKIDEGTGTSSKETVASGGVAINGVLRGAGVNGLTDSTASNENHQFSEQANGRHDSKALPETRKADTKDKDTFDKAQGSTTV